MLTGGLSRLIKVARTYAGSLSLAGSIAYSTVKLYTAAGALSLAGAVSRALNITRTYAGSLSLAGAITYITGIVNAYTAAGSLSLSGSVTRVIYVARTLSGSLSLTGLRVGPGGDVTNTGALSLAGVVGYHQVKYTRTLTAALSLAGRGQKGILKTYYFGVSG